MKILVMRYLTSGVLRNAGANTAALFEIDVTLDACGDVWEAITLLSGVEWWTKYTGGGYITKHVE